MSVAEEIGALEQRFADAILAKDLDTLKVILAPEFRLVGVRSTGTSDMPREAWFAGLGRMTFSHFEPTVSSVEVFGDMALATVEGSWTLQFDGRQIAENFYVTDVWVRRDGDWRIVRRHSSPYQPVTVSAAS